MHTWHPDDGRRLILPYFIIFCLQFVMSDMDNDVYSIFKKLLVPVAVLIVSTKRIPLSRYLAATTNPQAMLQQRS